MRFCLLSTLPAGIPAIFLLLCGRSTKQFATASSSTVTPPKTVNEPPAVTPGSLTFVQVTATTTTQTVDVVSQNLDAIKATLVSGTDFHLAQAISCVQGAATCHIAVAFSPVQPEMITGALLLTNTVTGLATTVPLAGTSSLPNTTPIASPAGLMFTSTLVEITTPVQTLNVTSPDLDPISARLTTGSSSFLMPQISSCPAGAPVCQVSIALKPTQSGELAGVLVITDTLTGFSTTVTLSGVGTVAPPPILALPPILAPNALLFGNIQEGSVSATLTLSATSPSNDPLTLQITGSQFNLVPGSSCTSPAASCLIGITFSPASVSSANGSLKVTDTTTGLFSTATLTGVGTAIPAPATSFSAASIPAPPTTLGSTTADQPVTLTNTGNATLLVSSVALSGTNPGDFSQTNTCLGPIAVNASCNLFVSFTSLALGARAAVLQIGTNASLLPATLQLSGNGTQNPATILVSGANAYIPFTEGTGSVAKDFSGNGNDCIFGTGTNAPYWTRGGLQLNDDTDASPKFCSLPASSSNADLSVMNSRTLTMCAYFNPQTVPFGYYYTSAFEGSDRDHIAALWLSGDAHGRAAFYMGNYFGQGGVPTWSSQPLVGYRCVTYALGSTTDGTLDHFYIDGSEVTSYGAQGTVWDRRMPGDFYQVGAMPWNTGAYLWGTVYTVLTIRRSLQL